MNGSHAASAPLARRPTPTRGDHVVLPGGERLWVLDGPASADAGRTPLVLLHGYLDSHASFSPLLPFLPGDRRVIAPDLRGHGRSFRPGSGYGMAHLAADVLALLDALSIERAAVVGHSMGSFVGQRLAAAAPGRVEALVLVGGAPSVHPMNGIADLEGAVEALRDPVSEEFVREFQLSTIAGSVPGEFLERIVAESLLVPARTMASLFAGMRATAPLEPGHVTAPALLLWGTEDVVFGRDTQQELLATLPNARLRELPGVGHAVHWEAPERVAAEVRDFLAEITGSNP